MNKNIQESWILIDKYLQRSLKTLSNLAAKGDKTAAVETMKLLSAVITIRGAVGLDKDDYGNIIIKPKKNNRKVKSKNNNEN